MGMPGPRSLLVEWVYQEVDTPEGVGILWDGYTRGYIRGGGYTRGGHIGGIPGVDIQVGIPGVYYGMGIPGGILEEVGIPGVGILTDSPRPNA